MISRSMKLAVFSVGLVLGFSVLAADYAEARRGGSFGNRGSRTFQSAPATRTAPQNTAPVERSMTPNTAPSNSARQPRAASRPGGFMNNFGGSMLRGLVLGGIIGVLLGQGFGGLAGMFGFLVQALIIGLLVMVAVRFFKTRSPAQAMATSTGGGSPRFGRAGGLSNTNDTSFFKGAGLGSSSGARGEVSTVVDIELEQSDLDTFEKTLREVQEAFGGEDHAALRRLTTPEMVSYLSEELAENAQKGVRNDVSEIRLLQADVAESWREDEQEYATAALRYASRDVTLDRATGRILEGDAYQASESTELWTFTRRRGSEWKVSAIQEA